MGDRYWYPTVEDVLAIHADIVTEYPDTSPGVRSRGDVAFALEYVEEGRFGAVPETIQGKAYHLLRLLVANHPFVDGNKRTALNTVVVFARRNGCRIGYDHEIRDVLKRFGTDQAAVTERAVVDLLWDGQSADPTGAVQQGPDDPVGQGRESRIDDAPDPESDPGHTHAESAASRDRSGERAPLDDETRGGRRDLVCRVAEADREEHRDIYDALEAE